MPDEVKPPRRMAAAVAEQMHLSHASHSGEHTHSHSTYGAQGEDSTHSHAHSHSNDSSHRHHAVVTTASAGAALPFGMMSFAGEPTHIGVLLPIIEPLGVPADGLSLTASSMLRLGSPLGIEGSNESGWTVLQAKLSEGALTAAAWDNSFETYQEALAAVAQTMATGADRPVLAETWRSDMAFENVSTMARHGQTRELANLGVGQPFGQRPGKPPAEPIIPCTYAGDGRKILGGGCTYRDCPLPLMLQTVTEPGHSGAVLAGSIQQAGTVGYTAVGTGDFDATDAGRQFLAIVQARGRFGVSIDVAEAEGEFLCTEEDGDGYCIDGEMQFSMVKIMGVTGTPFPAFEDAYIEIAENARPVAASGAPEVAEPCDDCEPVTDPAPSSFAIVAAGGPAVGRTEFFHNPDFEKERREYLVRQPDGQMLCPLTIIPATGQVFGHFFGAKTCHTGYESCVTAPRSRTGYAAFNLRPYETAEGELVTVGAIAMGCGHIPDDGSVPLSTVKAFYDGGPGAVTVAYVRAGDDRFGGWFAGTLAEGLSDAQVRKFSRLSVSGHWKEVWRGKGLDLVACAAGIPVPGFPVSAMAAAGFVEDIEAGYRLPAPSVAFKDGRPIALVAAGVVRQPMPWERMIAAQQEQIDALRLEMGIQQVITRPLLPVSAQRLAASMEPANTNG
jgi:hypothetical protein